MTAVISCRRIREGRRARPDVVLPRPRGVRAHRARHRRLFHRAELGRHWLRHSRRPSRPAQTVRCSGSTQVRAASGLGDQRQLRSQGAGPARPAIAGARQEQFLKTWGEDWAGADFKVVLSQTIFSYATHISQGNRLLADLQQAPLKPAGNAHGPGSAVASRFISAARPTSRSAQYGLDDWRNSRVAFCIDYPRKWLPLDPPVRPVVRSQSPATCTGGVSEQDHLTYANPTAFPAPLTNLAASASGHGLVRFDNDAPDHHGMLAARGGRHPAGREAIPAGRRRIHRLGRSTPNRVACSAKSKNTTASPLRWCRWWMSTAGGDLHPARTDPAL